MDADSLIENRSSIRSIAVLVWSRIDRHSISDLCFCILLQIVKRNFWFFTLYRIIFFKTQILNKLTIAPTKWWQQFLQQSTLFSKFLTELLRNQLIFYSFSKSYQHPTRTLMHFWPIVHYILFTQILLLFMWNIYIYFYQKSTIKSIYINYAESQKLNIEHRTQKHNYCYK